MENKVCVISIYVPKLQEAIEFYTNTLGFEVSKHYGSTIASLVNGDLPLILEEHADVTPSQNTSISKVVLALKTNNIYETAKSLKEKNVKFIVDEPTDCPPGKFISFTDPFGNILEYLQFDHE